MACRKRGHPSGWIRREKRLRLYQRDRFTCVYCGLTHPREKLTIEHVCSRNNGGHNHERNLVTACRSCNSSRQDKDLKTWCSAKGLDYSEIQKRIRNATRRRLPDYLPDGETMKSFLGDPTTDDTLSHTEEIDFVVPSFLVKDVPRYAEPRAQDNYENTIIYFCSDGVLLAVAVYRDCVDTPGMEAPDGSVSKELTADELTLWREDIPAEDRKSWDALVKEWVKRRADTTLSVADAKRLVFPNNHNPQLS